MGDVIGHTITAVREGDKLTEIEKPHLDIEVTGHKDLFLELDNGFVIAVWCSEWGGIRVGRCRSLV
tara:strand:- start:1130 stop:1327 length:198 start_codon:yes stop_codon:yes gene_type:complete